MKALVLYRSFFGNTRQVGEAIAREIRALGHDAIVQDVREALPELAGVDLVVVGSPTRIKGANRRARRAVRQLRRNGFEGRLVAVFDTYGPVPTDPDKLEKGRVWLFPGASGALEKLAREQGLPLHGEPLRCEVVDMKGPLADGAEAKATAFARSVVAAAQARP